MQTEPNVRAIDGEEPPLELEQEEVVKHDHYTEPYEEAGEDLEPEVRAQWMLSTLVAVVIAVWTAVFVYSNRTEMLAGADLAKWLDWIAAWSTPVLLLCVAWLLFARLSRKEAARFGDAARQLSMESEHLEARLHSVNRELSLAREFLSSQTLELESLGRVAGERISTNADRLQGLIQENGAQVDRIAGVSTTALDNMNRLRDDLPVIANSARDVSNKIGAAGREADGQLASLVAGFERLNTFGQASERQVEALNARTEAVLQTLDGRLLDIESRIEKKFAAIGSEHEVSVQELDAYEVRALAGIRGRAEALRSELASSSADLVQGEEAACASINERIDSLRAEAGKAIEEIADAQRAAAQEWYDQTEHLRTRLAAVSANTSEIETRALEAMQRKLKDLAVEAEALDVKLTESDAAFDSRLAEKRDALNAHEVAAIQAFEGRLVTLDARLSDLVEQSEDLETAFNSRNNAFVEALASRRLAMSEAEREMRGDVTTHFEELNALLAQKRAEHAEHIDGMVRQSETVRSRVEAISNDMDAIREQNAQAARALADEAARVATILSESHDGLGPTHEAIMGLTDGSVRLLELIQASAKHARDELPPAIEGFETTLSDVEQRSDALRERFANLIEQGRRLDTSVEAASLHAASGWDQIRVMRDELDATTGSQRDQLDELAGRLDALAVRNTELARETRAQLDASLEGLDTKSRAALLHIEEVQAERIANLADRIGSEAAEAIDRTLSEKMAEALTSLSEATENAEAKGRETAVLLRDQLSRINELTSNLEARVARARERAAESVDNDFSRRVALITDSLNSAAIDIGKAMSSDVSDTAWASYMKGDRGIFTRRAVRLLDTTTARDIAQLYDEDPDFREHVSRFVHDFEAMLRMLLSTRDGQPLGVTVLGSDVGKLYVALAQAIERLRE